jgi:hypothetical protein
MAGGTKVATFAGKSQQIFMPAVSTFDPGETVTQVTAVEIAVDNLSGIGPKKAIFSAKVLIINLFKGLEVVFNTLIVR